MQIVKHTSWTVDEIYKYDIKEISKMAKWAYNQEVAERENLFIVSQWHLGSQSKKSAKKSAKHLTKALKQQSYNPAEDRTVDWVKMFKAYAPNTFDKYIKSLK